MRLGDDLLRASGQDRLSGGFFAHAIGQEIIFAMAVLPDASRTEGEPEQASSRAQFLIARIHAGAAVDA